MTEESYEEALQTRRLRQGHNDSANLSMLQQLAAQRAQLAPTPPQGYPAKSADFVGTPQAYHPEPAGYPGNAPQSRQDGRDTPSAEKPAGEDAGRKKRRNLGVWLGNALAGIDVPPVVVGAARAFVVALVTVIGEVIFTRLGWLAPSDWLVSTPALIAAFFTLMGVLDQLGKPDANKGAT